MLFEKVMEEGRSYLKSEMAHRGGASWARACIRVRHPARMLSAVQRAKVRALKREQGREGPYAQDIAESQPRIRCNRARSAWGKDLQDRTCASGLPPCGGP